VLDGVVEVGYPMNVINACFRSAYRLAYPLAKRWWAWRGHNGTAVAVWSETACWWSAIHISRDCACPAAA
jgi:hypothetical protein